MKSNIYGAFMIIALALIVSIPIAQAEARINAQVPFDFNLDQKSAPAGGYEISSLNNSVLVLRNLDTREARLVIKPMHVQVSQTPNAKLVFHKYGDQYFLVEIWDGQGNIGIAFPESKREKELQAANSVAPQQVVVVAMK